jgi:hypothetical protein
MEFARKIYEVRNPNTRAWYYDSETGMFYQWNGFQWNRVSEEKVKEALNKKAYIDNPNLHYTAFLNPRNIFFGLKLNFNF